MADTVTVGIFTSEQEQYLAKLIDSMLALKGITGIIVGYALKVVIPLIDNKLIDKLSAGIKTQIIEIVSLLMDGTQLGKAKAIAIDLTEKINKLKPRDIDETVFKAAAGLVAGALLQEIETKSQVKISLVLTK
jgi:hypothetical protein